MTVPVPSCEAIQGRGVPISPAWTMRLVWQRDATAVLRKGDLDDLCGEHSGGDV